MSKRPLLAATCFFVAGVLLTIFNIDVLLICGAGFIFSVAVFLYKSDKMPFIFLCLIFLLAGCLRTTMAQRTKDDVLREFDGKNQIQTMTVTEFSERANAVAEFNSQGKIHKVYFYMEEPTELKPGDIIKTRISFSEPYSDKVSPSGFSEYLLSRRIYLYGDVNDVQICGQERSGIKGVVYSVRRYMNNVGEARFAGEARALFNSIVFGDKHLMDDNLTDKLQKAGLNHIAAVSGMHLSVVVEAVMIFLGRLFGRRRRGSAFSIPVIIAITLLTGAGASVVRACIMCIMYSLARILRRENDPLTSLSVSVLLMTLFNPYIVFNAGFVLSVAAVIGIFLFNKKVSSVISRYLPGFVAEVIAVTVSAQLTVTIPVLYYFGILTPYSVLSNLLVTPFANLSIVAGMVLVIVDKIPLLGTVAAIAEKCCLTGIVAVCNIVGKLPFAIISFSLKWSIVIAWLFIMIMIFAKNINTDILFRITAVFMIVFFVVTSAEMQSKNRINMYFVNYGSREMTAAFFPDGESVLIDCHQSSTAISMAENHGKSQYDYIIFTTSYIGNLQRLADNGFAGTVIVPEFAFNTDSERQKIESFKKQGVQIIYLQENEVFWCKNAYIKLYSLNHVGNENAVVEIEYMGKTFVFMQAIGYSGIEELKKSPLPIDCDYLKLSGADFHTEKELINVTNGKILKKEKELTANLY